MTIEFHGIDMRGESPELDHQELDHRLRGLSWPAAPPEVRQRCLQAVLRAAEGLDGAVEKPAEDVRPVTNGHGAEARIGPIERVRRYESTRWEPRGRPVGWPAPRRQPRFAAVL